MSTNLTGRQERRPIVTIRHVAQEVGLSITTVSRALNGHGDVAPATRQLVKEAARSLDYHPNHAARSLQNAHAGAAGLVIPSTLHRAYDAFWLDFIGGVAATCSARGSDLLISMPAAVEEPEQTFGRLVRGRRIDGVLICDVRRDDPRIAYLQRYQFPFVAFGRTAAAQNYSYIDVDGAAGVAQAIEHLVALGHRRIAYLGVDSSFSFSHFRLLGYRSALSAAGIPWRSEFVAEDLTEATIGAAVHRMVSLSDRPTAVFAAADFLALATARVARELGLSIPADLSLAVFDDNLPVQQANPPLTAVRQPNRRLGEEAGALLLDHIARGSQPLVQRLVTPTLVIRSSTGPVRLLA